jgi:putative hemolysin
MGIVAIEIAVVLVLIAINGIFSMSELAIVSARRVRLQHLADRGNPGARKAIELADNPRRFLSTVQIGITLVGILAGAFGGATLSSLLAAQLESIPTVAPYAATISFVVVVLAITYFSIILGELIPKSFALSAPEKIAIAVSRPMNFISRLASPVAWLLSAPTTAILKLFRLHARVEPPVTDEEIMGLIDAGTRAGVFEQQEQNLFESVMELGEQRVTSLMTPRTKIAWLDLDDPPEVIRKRLQVSAFSRLPVGRGTLDNIQGYVTAKSVLRHLLKDKDFDLSGVLQKPLYVPETVDVLELLEKFRESATHLAVIVDEFGGIEGLVTAHDLLEVIIGELANSPHAPPGPLFRKLADGSIVLDGRLAVHEFVEALEINELPDDEKSAYQTVAGFVLTRLGRIPSVGDHFNWGRYHFQIAVMERNRVSKVIAKPDPLN